MYGYDGPRSDEPGGWRETLILTRAALSVLLGPVVALLFMMGVLVAAVVLFAAHPALALIPIAVLVVAVVLFARWERGRFRRPGA